MLLIGRLIAFLISPIVPLHLIKYHIILALHIGISHRNIMSATICILSLFSHTTPFLASILFPLISALLSAFLL